MIIITAIVNIITVHTGEIISISRADWLKNRSLYDKSMKLGTLLEHDMRIIFSYRAISDLTSDLCGSYFFQIADKVFNSLLSILFLYNFDHYT